MSGWPVKRQVQACVTTQGAGGEDLRPQAHGSFLLNAHCGGSELSPPLPRWGPGGSWLTSELRGHRGHSLTEVPAGLLMRLAVFVSGLCGEGICTSRPGVDPD